MRDELCENAKKIVDIEVQERDEDVERAESMLRMMRERESDREREREREQNREAGLREKAKGIGSRTLMIGVSHAAA